MNADLERTLDELGPEYRDVVARLRASREVAPSRSISAPRPARLPALRRGVPALAAASIAAVFAMAVLFFAQHRGGNAADEVPLTVYTVAYAPTEEALEAIVASQRADGSWANDFVTMQNAAALRASGEDRMRVAYRRAVRYLRSKGLAPLTDSELRERGRYAAKALAGA